MNVCVFSREGAKMEIYIYAAGDIQVSITTSQRVIHVDINKHASQKEPVTRPQVSQRDYKKGNDKSAVSLFHP